jgi:hypothetical protein
VRKLLSDVLTGDLDGASPSPSSSRILPSSSARLQTRSPWSLWWKFYIFFCVIDALFFILVWFLFPETKGKSLEEVAAVFEDTHVGGVRDIDTEKLGDVTVHEEETKGSK